MKMYRATIPVMSASLLSGFDGRTCLFVFDLAAVREARLREYFIVPVDSQLALIDGGLEEVQQVARIHLAGVVGERGGQIDRADDFDALVHDSLAGAGELAVATLLGGDIHDHRARTHALDRRPGDDFGCRASWDGSRADDGIDGG